MRMWWSWKRPTRWHTVWALIFSWARRVSSLGDLHQIDFTLGAIWRWDVLCRMTITNSKPCSASFKWLIYISEVSIFSIPPGFCFWRVLLNGHLFCIQSVLSSRSQVNFQLVFSSLWRWIALGSHWNGRNAKSAVLELGNIKRLWLVKRVKLFVWQTAPMPLVIGCFSSPCSRSWPNVKDSIYPIWKTYVWRSKPFLKSVVYQAKRSWCIKQVWNSRNYAVSSSGEWLDMRSQRKRVLGKFGFKQYFQHWLWM